MGGQMTDRQQMLRMESISVAVNLLMLAVVAARAGYLGGRIPPTALTIVLWVMTVLFLLNTLGNLLSQNTLERLVFTPLTAVLCVLCLRRRCRSALPRCVNKRLREPVIPQSSVS